MTHQKKCMYISAILWVHAVLCAAPNQPCIGYVYPAGGRQGSEVYVTAGGQFLWQPRSVHISGSGVRGTIIRFYPPIKQLRKEQQVWIINRLKEAVENCSSNPLVSQKEAAIATKETKPKRLVNHAPQVLPDNIKIPEHPLLYELETKSLRQLVHVQQMLLRPQSQTQPNRQIAEMVLLKLTIDPDAEPGLRELRILTAAGLTNPITIHIGTLPEYDELEPNDQEAYPTRVQRFPDLPDAKPLELPIVLNGQILPGDVDRFRFHAQAGQQLVLETHARSLIPYLADAVPGWFQAVAALYDAAGNEIAFADDYRFNPDPVLYYKISKTGDYELVIHDSIYRGREDFVYRVSVGELPFITEMFPLGGKEGRNTVASIAGWNLPQEQLTLNTSTGAQGIGTAVLRHSGMSSNFVPYAVDTLPEVVEAESHARIDTAQQVSLPVIINGRINEAGQADLYQFNGKKGCMLALEVFARRLNSPLDSLLRVMDTSGKIISWNDDCSARTKDYLFKDAEGLLTHHADSRLSVRLPSDGTYYLSLTDSQGHGGSAYGYRLHLSEEKPDFELRVTPSGFSAPAGGVIPVTVHVLPKNGFDGEIKLSLKHAAPGFQIHGQVIPPGKDSICMTIRVPGDITDPWVSLELEGRAEIDGRVITRKVVAADDKMQAFLYRHLVPSSDFVVAVQRTKWSVPSVELLNDGPIEIAPGDSVQVYLGSSAHWLLRQLHLQIQNPPAGITLGDMAIVPRGLRFSLRADSSVQPGFSDNLIIHAFRKDQGRDSTGQTSDKPQLKFVGVIPAISFRVTAPPRT